MPEFFTIGGKGIYKLSPPLVYLLWFYPSELLPPLPFPVMLDFYWTGLVDKTFQR